MQQIEYWDSGPDYVKMANGSTYLMILYKDIFFGLKDRTSLIINQF